jgi:hypothetical protein
MKAKSIKGRSTEEISFALAECMADAHPDEEPGRGFKPTLAIVFMSVKQDREAISKFLDEKAFRYLVPPLQANLLMGKSKRAVLS